MGNYHRESSHHQHYEGLLAGRNGGLWIGVGPLGYGWYHVDRRGFLSPVVRGGKIKAMGIGEVVLPVVNVSATVPPHAPTASAIIARVATPSEGRVVGLAVCVAVAPTAGTGTDHTQGLRCRNAGAAGSGTTVVTADAVVKDQNLTPDDLPVAGTVRRGSALNIAGNVFGEGHIIDIHYNETGTIGTGTRATFNLLGVLYECATDADFVRA